MNLQIPLTHLSNYQLFANLVSSNNTPPLFFFFAVVFFKLKFE